MVALWWRRLRPDLMHGQTAQAATGGDASALVLGVSREMCATWGRCEAMGEVIAVL